MIDIKIEVLQAHIGHTHLIIGEILVGTDIILKIGLHLPIVPIKKILITTEVAIVSPVVTVIGRVVHHRIRVEGSNPHPIEIDKGHPHLIEIAGIVHLLIIEILIIVHHHMNDITIGKGHHPMKDMIEKDPHPMNKIDRLIMIANVHLLMNENKIEGANPMKNIMTNTTNVHPIKLMVEIKNRARIVSNEKVTFKNILLKMVPLL